VVKATIMNFINRVKFLVYPVTVLFKCKYVGPVVDSFAGLHSPLSYVRLLFYCLSN